jgi:carboxymethylenebutenolidase
MRIERPILEAPGGSLPAFLAAPDEQPPGPAVVVIQEWWGLVPHIEDVSRRLAGEGFTAVAPDLYRGRQTDEPDEARKLAMDLDREAALVDLAWTVGRLLDGRATAVGAMGFCMGGGLVWSLAHREDRLGAAVVFYGLADERGRLLRCPLLAHYGTADRYPQDQLEALRRELAAEGPEAELLTYDGAPHAFFNDTRPSFRPEAASEAWERTVEFLRRHLGT